MGPRRAAAIPQRVIEREGLLEVGDLPAQVADHDHQVGKGDEQVRALALVPAVAGHDRHRAVPVLRGVVPGEQRRRLPTGLERVRHRPGGIAGRAGEPVVERQRRHLAVAGRALDRGGRLRVQATPARALVPV